MADVLSRSNLFSICSNRSVLVSGNKRRNLSVASFYRCESQSFEGLSYCSGKNGYFGKRLDFGDRFGKTTGGNPRKISAQATLSFPKAIKWWDQGSQHNMKEIKSAQDLVDSLANAGNKLVVVDFYSPGCGGCKALHPKICQFSEMNPDVAFLQVNSEEHKSMGYSLNVHVLPLFRFYRGASRRLCSFSCTNATIKKFRDALVKHSTERCSLGPAKGLEESELLALDANKDLSFTYRKKPVSIPEQFPSIPNLPVVQPSRASQQSSDKSLVIAWR